MKKIIVSIEEGDYTLDTCLRLLTVNSFNFECHFKHAYVLFPHCIQLSLVQHHAAVAIFAL